MGDSKTFNIPAGTAIWIAPVGASLDGWTASGAPVTLTNEGVTVWTKVGETR